MRFSRYLRSWPGARSLGRPAPVSKPCQEQYRKARARGLGPLQGKSEMPTFLCSKTQLSEGWGTGLGNVLLTLPLFASGKYTHQEAQSPQSPGPCLGMWYRRPRHGIGHPNKTSCKQEQLTHPCKNPSTAPACWILVLLLGSQGEGFSSCGSLEQTFLSPGSWLYMRPHPSHFQRWEATPD